MSDTEDGVSAVGRADLNRWRLTTTGGNHHWKYISKADLNGYPLSFAERYFLGLSTVRLTIRD